MGFGDLKSAAGLKALDSFLSDKSYIEGYQPSQADVVVSDAVGSAPDAAKYVNAARWFKHIASYCGPERTGLPGSKKAVDQYGPGAKPAGDDDEDDDDMNLFDESEDEEAAAEAERVRQERVAAYKAKKAAKPVVIAKSNIILDVKPWDDETDMSEMERKVRSLEADGLLWGAAKLVPVGYGIKKLQISCVVEDDKIGTDFLEEEITAFEDLVQSVDIVAFNKI